MPAKDFEISKAFYLALGWKQTWGDSHLAVMENANQRFYLQNYYVREWAENFMLHVSVEDAESWKQHVTKLMSEKEFSGVRVDGPKQEEYGALVTYVWDPSGVLIHFAQWTDD
ncbi:MAG TPA: glyoxalase [Xanthomonadales bacterium]|nr:glyoxalase [Xanthomonadales bacterium]